MWKLQRVLLSATIALGLLAGCGSGSAEVSSGAEVTQPTASKEEVTIGFSSEPENWDPCQGYGTTGPIIFSTLVEFDADMQVVNDLATDYTISDDMLEWVFTIRDDAVFTDGEPVKASDVAFTFNTAKNSASYVDLTMMESCEADGNTVTFLLKKPTSTFVITASQIGIVPEHAYGDRFGVEPVGSGPYKLAQWDKGQQFILEANERYYGSAPAIRRAVFLVTADEDARLIAAKSGQVDVSLTSATIASVNTVPGMELVALPTVDNMGIAMPVVPDEGKLSEDGYKIGNNVTSDIAIRKAVSYGIDRERICEEAFNGYADPAYTECDGLPWWNPETAIETDVAYAVSLLEEAGWIDSDGDGIREKDGVKASFPLMYMAGDSARQATALSAANQAKEALGIEMLVEGVSSSDITTRFFSDPLILAWGSSNPMTSYMLFHSSNAGNTDWYNPENFTDPAVDAHLEAALNSRTIEDSVPHWQNAQYDGETGSSMKGQAPYPILINKQHLYFVREGLDIGKQKLHAHGDAWPLVANLREWKWN